VSDTHAAYKNRFLATQSVLGLPTSRGYLVFDELLVGTFEEAFIGRQTLFHSFSFRLQPSCYVLILLVYY
jgi:hypothetical protein